MQAGRSGKATPHPTSNHGKAEAIYWDARRKADALRCGVFSLPEDCGAHLEVSFWAHCDRRMRAFMVLGRELYLSAGPPVPPLQRKSVLRHSLSC